MSTARALLLAFVTLVLATPALAQGSGHGAGSSGARGHGSPPGRSILPGPVTLAGPAGATPFAWIDDAALLEPGVLWLGVSAMRWAGAGQGEVELPVVDAAVGLSRRLQIGASVPHVRSNVDSGFAGGLGTAYVNAKVGLAAKGPLEIAAAPTVQILNTQALTDTANRRTRIGIPISLGYELSERTRIFGGTGFFWGGVWFAGGGGSVRATERLFTTLSFSSAWTSPADSAPRERRHEVTAGASYALMPAIGLFGSIGRTVATLDDNGAGTTVTVGVSFMFGSGRIDGSHKRK